MYRSTIRIVGGLALVGALTLCFGGGSVIGLAVIDGTVSVDHSNVRGSASILDGSVIETGKGSSHLSLQSGTRVEFGAGSRGTIYQNHVVLEKGNSQFHAVNGFPLLANSLQVVSMGSDSTVRVAVKNSKSIIVSAVAGQARVLNSSGLLLAKVMPGSTLEFDEQAGAAAQAQLTGKVTKTGSNYYIKDETTGVVSQLTCADMGSHVNKRVTVTGSIDTSATPAAGATQVVCVSTGGIKALGGAAAGAAGGATAAGIAGLSVGATVAVVGGVAVAGILIGLGATGNLGNSSSP